MDLKQNRSYLVATAILSLSVASHAGLTIDAAPAVDGLGNPIIDPTGGAAIAYQNTNMGSWYHAGTGSFTNINKATMLARPGVQVLDFESASGFDTANARYYINNTSTDVNQFGRLSTAETSTPLAYAIDTVRMGGHDINFQQRSFNVSTQVLGAPNAAGGVFLVTDRATTPVMVSGTQGIAAAPTNQGGTYITFDADVQAFSVVGNNGNAKDAFLNMVVVLFDANDVILGTYGPTSTGNNTALYFGTVASNPSSYIRKVWLGSQYNTNGVVFDDLAIQYAVPEPASLGVLALGALILKSRRAR